jgi:hypothetical protein
VARSTEQFAPRCALCPALALQPCAPWIARAWPLHSQLLWSADVPEKPEAGESRRKQTTKITLLFFMTSVLFNFAISLFVPSFRFLFFFVFDFICPNAWRKKCKPGGFAPIASLECPFSPSTLS